MNQPRKLALVIDTKCQPDSYYNEDGSLKNKKIRKIITTLFSDHSPRSDFASLVSLYNYIGYKSCKKRIRSSLRQVLSGKNIPNPQDIHDLLEELEQRIIFRPSKWQGSPSQETLEQCQKLFDDILLYIRDALAACQADKDTLSSNVSPCDDTNSITAENLTAERSAQEFQDIFRQQFIDNFVSEHENICAVGDGKIVLKKLGKKEKVALKEILYEIVMQYYTFLCVSNIANGPRFFLKRSYLESFFSSGEKSFSLATLETAITAQLKILIDDGDITRHKEEILKRKPVYTISSEPKSEGVDD